MEMRHKKIQEQNRVPILLGCIKGSIASKLREVLLPLCSQETQPGILSSGQDSSPQERYRPVGDGPEEGPKVDLREGAPLL